jgi:hypothetical protein
VQAVHYELRGNESATCSVSHDAGGYSKSEWADHSIRIVSNCSVAMEFIGLAYGWRLFSSGDKRQTKANICTSPAEREVIKVRKKR